MFRNYQQFFITLFYVYFLPISSISSPRVIVTIGAPKETETRSRFLLYGVENFDTLAHQRHEDFVSIFDSSGYESVFRGTYSDKKSAASIQGRYSGLTVVKNDVNGGVGPEGVAYAKLDDNSEVQLTNTGPWGINYFGFHGEALTPENRIEFYFGTDMIFNLRMDDIIYAVENPPSDWADFTGKYSYNPNPEFEGRMQGKPFVFVNVFFKGATFDKIKFQGVPFHTDVHTFGFYTWPSGSRNLDVTTCYMPPENEPMVASKQPVTMQPIFPVAHVRITFDPSYTDSRARLGWSVREDFERVPEGNHAASYTSYFEPNDVIQGTYSAPFDILWNSKNGRYFATTDSLLNLTVTGGKEINFFGFYLNPLNRYGSLEFFQNGERIFILYLVDVLDAIANNSENVGDTTFKTQPGDQTNTENFGFLNIRFVNIIYDAVRIRNWSRIGGDAAAVASDNHFIGDCSGQRETGYWVEELRTIIKKKSFPATGTLLPT